MSLEQGQVLNNRYRIDALLGKGGFGAVYRGWDTSFDMACAIKENNETSQDAQRQFQREAQLLHTLRHANLPLVKDHFIIQGQGQYLVMDFVEGEDLQSMLDRTAGPLPEHQVLSWLVEICDALTYLHTHKPPVIHRDLKPANIKITPQGRVYLVDFGISKVYDPNVKTTMGARAVSMGFSPLEQYGQGATDPRTDIYALGATAYALLTGQVPVESVVRAGGAPLPKPSQLNPQISPRVEAAVLRAMELQPNARFASAQEFKTALLPGSVQHLVQGSLEQALPYEVQPRTQVVKPPSQPQPGIARTQLAPAPPLYPGAAQARPAQPISRQPAEKAGSSRWLLIGGVGVVLFILILCGGGGLYLNRAGFFASLAGRGPTQTAESLSIQATATSLARPTPTHTKIFTPTMLPTHLPTFTPTPVPFIPSATFTFVPTNTPFVSIEGNWFGYLLETIGDERRFDAKFEFSQPRKDTYLIGAVTFTLPGTDHIEVYKFEGSFDGVNFQFLELGGDRHFWGIYDGFRLSGEIAWGCYYCSSWGKFEATR